MSANSDPSTAGSPLSDSQAEFLRVYNNITVAVSLLALLIFYLSVLFTPNMQTRLSLRLVCNLFFADLINTLSNIVSNFSNTNDSLCQLEGFMKTFSLWSSVLWATTIGFVAYSKSVWNHRNTDAYYHIFCLVAYGLPILISILPLIPGISFFYETNGFICWINSDTGNIILIKWLFFFCWVWINLIGMTILYIRLYIYMKNLNINTGLEYRSLFVYPVILYMVMIPITISNSGLLTEYVFIITLLQVSTLHLIGLFNVLVYGLQKLRAVISTRNPSEHEFVRSQRAVTAPKPPIHALYSDHSSESSSRRQSNDSLQAMLRENAL